MRVRFTEEVIKKLACPEGAKDLIVFDEGMPGLCLRVTKAGKKVFGFRYKRAGQTKHLVLGAWGTTLTLARAQKRAREERGKVSAGADPFTERKAIEANEKAERQRVAFTVEAMIDQWGVKHLAQRTTNYRTQSENTLKAAFAKQLHKPAAGITKQDVRDSLDATVKARGPYAANHLHAAGHACWKFAIGRGDLEVNPWASVPKPAKAVARDRVLTDAEIAAVWQATEGMARTWRSMIRLLILTAQRRSEVAGMAWAELDLDNVTWVIPRERAKNGVSHLVPLSAAAIEIIRDQPREKGGVFVFRSRGETSPSGFSKMKARLDKALGDGVAPWVLHDLRRTAATGLQRLSVMPVVIEAALNHVSGTRSGIVGIYQRHQYEEERRDALNRWAAHVIGLVKEAEIERAPAKAIVKTAASIVRFLDEGRLRSIAENPGKRSKAIARIRERSGQFRGDRETEEKAIDRLLRFLETDGSDAGRLLEKLEDRRRAAARLLETVRETDPEVASHIERLDARVEDRSKSIRVRLRALQQMTKYLADRSATSSLEEADTKVP